MEGTTCQLSTPKLVRKAARLLTASEEAHNISRNLAMDHFYTPLRGLIQNELSRQLGHRQATNEAANHFE